MKRWILAMGCWMGAMGLPQSAIAADRDALAALAQVQREGVGNEQAAAAWKALVGRGIGILPELLRAYDGADAVVANWLRSAVDAVVEKETAAGRPLATEPIVKFIRDTQRDPRARDLALSILAQADAKTHATLLPELVNDPSGGVRRAALAKAIEDADIRASADGWEREMRRLFAASRDLDQVEAIAKKLKDRGKQVDLAAHYGVITHWLVRGPFDNQGLKGFSADLPSGNDWKAASTTDPRGMFDLYGALGKTTGLSQEGKKDAVYAIARVELESPTEQKAWIRVGSQNAIRIYLNGQPVFGREAYHHGHRMDQHLAPVTLRKGMNDLTLKILQDDRTYDWTFAWAFQCRVTDAIGTPLKLKQLTALDGKPIATPAPPKKKEQPKK